MAARCGSGRVSTRSPTVPSSWCRPAYGSPSSAGWATSRSTSGPGASFTGSGSPEPGWDGARSAFARAATSRSSTSRSSSQVLPMPAGPRTTTMAARPLSASATRAVSSSRSGTRPARSSGEREATSSTGRSGAGGRSARHPGRHPDRRASGHARRLMHAFMRVYMGHGNQDDLGRHGGVRTPAPGTSIARRILLPRHQARQVAGGQAHGGNVPRDPGDVTVARPCDR